jgi:hypothetical protein
VRIDEIVLIADLVFHLEYKEIDIACYFCPFQSIKILLIFFAIWLLDLAWCCITLVMISYPLLKYYLINTLR